MNETTFYGAFLFFSIQLNCSNSPMHWWFYGQIESESLSRSNELDQMREKLEHRKLLMGKMSMRSKVVKEKVRKQEERLSGEIRSLLIGGSSISVANKRMQVMFDYVIWLSSLVFLTEMNLWLFSIIIIIICLTCIYFYYK